MEHRLRLRKNSGKSTAERLEYTTLVGKDRTGRASFIKKENNWQLLIHPRQKLTQAKIDRFNDIDLHTPTINVMVKEAIRLSKIPNLEMKKLVYVPKTSESEEFHESLKNIGFEEQGEHFVLDLLNPDLLTTLAITMDSRK